MDVCSRNTGIPPSNSSACSTQKVAAAFGRCDVVGDHAQANDAHGGVHAHDGSEEA
jgi:hypothetical protein